MSCLQEVKFFFYFLILLTESIHGSKVIFASSQLSKWIAYCNTLILLKYIFRFYYINYIHPSLIKIITTRSLLEIYTYISVKDIRREFSLVSISWKFFSLLIYILFFALIEIIYIIHGNPDKVGPCTPCLSYKGVKWESPLGERSQYVWHEIEICLLKGQPSALQNQRPFLQHFACNGNVSMGR